MTININPYVTTNAAGSFLTSTGGLIVGTALDQPAVRYQLKGGILDTVANGETLPMFGGVAIFEKIPGVGTPTTPSTTLGSTVGRSTGLAGSKPILGFSVFDQNYAAINSPQSPVPLVNNGGMVNYYRLGSLARICVAIDPALVSLDGTLVNSQVSWDYTAQKIVAYTPAYSAVTISGATWASTSGGQTTFTVGTDLTAVLAAGSTIDVSGVVSTGGTGVGYNGNFVVVSVPDSTHVVVTQASASSPGTYSSGGTIAAGGGALPAKIDDIQIGNCLVPTYNLATGFCTWNANGSGAVIQI